MQLDLLTILALRLCVDGLATAAFFAQSRRHPSVGGPGWWTVSGLLAGLGSVGLGLRPDGPELLTFGVANTAFVASAAFLWIGLRSYLGQPYALRPVLAALLAVFVGNVLLTSVWDSMAARQTLFSVAGVVIAGVALHDIRRFDPIHRVLELQVLRWVTWFKLVALIGLAVSVWFLPVSATGERTSPAVPVLLLATMIDVLLRLVIFSSLVTLRLQQQGDRARQVLQTREADSRALIENLSAGVMVFRPDQTLASVNSAARRFLGWSECDARSAMPEPLAPDWRLLREDGRPMPRHEVPFERVLATGQPVADVIMGMQSGDGAQTQWALCNAYPENDAIGGLRHVMFTFVDITSLRQAQWQQQALEQQLAQSQKMEALGTLAGGVAHDFNNILAAILGNADLARQDLPPGAPARESLHEISAAARRGRELVRQVLAFSRQQPMQRKPVCVGDILAESCSLLRAATPSQVQLVQCFATGTPDIQADPTQIGQVLLNLGTNAVHALKGQPGRIEFRVDTVPPGDPNLPAELARSSAISGVGAVRVMVTDDGCGMDAATRNRIFEPFFTTKAVGSGTGLGLPVVLGIVQAHGGAIQVDSVPGQGTTFMLYFPAAPHTEPAPKTPLAANGGAGLDGGTMAPEHRDDSEPPLPTSVETPAMADDLITAQRHILYLDDDDTLVFLVRRLLERRGYKVTTFTDQKQAIDAVRNEPAAFDLLMTDYNMPGMSGLDVARSVLALSPNLPVAVASGYITDELQAEAVAAGVREVVFKTDAVEAFCEVVARLVAPPRPA
jgi:two-component system cell cycle sensor histidine kinase/response regulator CckA